MDTLFLLRSYGDFVVALSGYQQVTPTRKIALIASDHLRPLYEAIEETGVLAHLPNIEFVDIGVRQGLLSFFTNRHFFSIHTIKELRALKALLQSIPQHNTLFLEQDKRIGLIGWLTRKNFAVIHDGKTNIYKAYRDFLGNDILVSEVEEVDIQPGFNLLIFPGSRKKEKQLPIYWVNQLINQYTSNGINVFVGGLASEIIGYPGSKRVVSGFKDLCEMIKNADFIISADSLPAHLAFLYRKPLEVHYNGQINEPWLPPGAKAIIV